LHQFEPYFEPETMGPAVTEVMASTEALLFGRRTWQTMAAAWPSRAGDPFADRMNEIPKYVASRTLTQDELTWPGSTLLPASLTATTPMDRACRNDLVARGTIDMLWSRSPAAHGPHSRGPGDIDAKDGA
jgi:hypothetical protein